MSYSEQLKKISTIIGHESTVLKKIGPSPKGMSRFEYIAEILPGIDNYMITDKADGTRGIIEIDSNMAKCVIGSEYLEFPAKSPNACIIDCEVLIEQKKILIFDILSYDGSSAIKMPFLDRHALLEKINIKSDKFIFSVKKFYKLTTATYQKNIMALYMEMKKYSYDTDGIIFTSTSNEYSRTRHYKWKPAEHLTIDFLYVNGELWSGISRRQFKQIGLEFPDNYLDVANRWIRAQYGQIAIEFFPFPFTPSILPDIYKHPIVWGKQLPAKAINQIIEVSYDCKKNEWHFHRIRTDRVQELADGKYYGNNFKIAELTLENVMNPLTIGDLVKSKTELSKGFYFEKADNKYKSVRKYNSFVKGILIKRYTGSATVIDMASGKGQDLGRYYGAGIKNLLMLEIDQSAIDEIITRKFEFTNKLWIDGIDRPIQIANYTPQSTSLVVAQMDFNSASSENILKIESHAKKFKKAEVDVIICNMAIHYLVGSQKNIENVVKFISYWLRDGGDFVFTSMNSERILTLLKGSGKWSGKNEIYKIEKARPGHIKVLLPCSHELREEPLVDMAALDKEFKRHSIVRIETKAFDEFFEEYSKEKIHTSPLDDASKQFVGLYHYAIFKKIKSKVAGKFQ